MVKPPTFSIVTPSYNQARYLEQCIESVVSQAGDFYIDYVIADGGSTDGSVDIIRRLDESLKTGAYVAKCRGVTLRWWSRKDDGQSDALNQALRVVAGDFVAWLNSDDLYQPGAFREVVHAMAQNPAAGMVYSNWIVIDAGGRELERHLATPFDMHFELNHGNQIPQPTVFMRKNVLDRVGLLDPKYHFAMDYDLWIRIAKQSHAVCVSGWWAAFRRHDESKTVARAERFWNEEREIARKHGGKLFSRMYANHLAKRWPRPMRLLFSIENALRLVLRRDFGDVRAKLKRRLRIPGLSV